MRGQVTIPEPEAESSGKGWQARFARVRDGASHRLDAALRQYPWLALPVEFVRRWTSTNASVLAGHIAYRVFVFILPLLVLLVGLLGFAASSGTDIESTADENSGIGRALASTLADTGDQAKDGRLQLVVLGTFAVLFAASGLVKALQLVFAAAWGVSPKSGRSRIVVLIRFIPGVLVILGVVALRQWISKSGFVLTVGSEVLGMVIDAVALLALSLVLPSRATRVLDLVPGAVIGGIGLGALHIATLVYFPSRIDRASQLYGTLGVALVALLYLFLVGQVLVASALTNAVWVDRHEILADAKVATERD
jgi:membrane protein